VSAEGRLAGKVAVITGAASGIGRSTAELFVREGAHVHAVDRAGDLLADVLAPLGPSATGHVADVASSDGMAGLAREVLAEHPVVDIVFANAGIEGVGSAADLTEETWRRVIDVNLMGVWLSSKYFLDGMVSRGSGSIVHTASIGGLVGVQGILPYAAAKGGVIAMTRQMAVDYSPRGIRVNAVCPGTVVTPLVERNWQQKGQDVDEQMARLAARHPLGRGGTVEDIAAAVLYLASDEASWVTGQTLTVDGGYTAV
jgi:NAD(P)-dependent dehydrogenase (short-subunit alcohol dehydrogenase family)